MLVGNAVLAGHLCTSQEDLVRCMFLWDQVDGVSSIGALPFEMDKWGVDIAVTGSQKALSLPTGLALMAVSEKVGSSVQPCDQAQSS